MAKTYQVVVTTTDSNEFYGPRETEAAAKQRAEAFVTGAAFNRFVLLDPADATYVRVDAVVGLQVQEAS